MAMMTGRARLVWPRRVVELGFAWMVSMSLDFELDFELDFGRLALTSDYVWLVSLSTAFEWDFWMSASKFGPPKWVWMM